MYKIQSVITRWINTMQKGKIQGTLQGTLNTKEETAMVQKCAEKATQPKKQNRNKNKRGHKQLLAIRLRVVAGAHAHRRTIGSRAVASMKVKRRKQNKTIQT